MNRSNRVRGFTLIELMVVIAIIAIIAAILIPNLLLAHIEANETAAIATLRNIVSAEALFQAAAKADTDGDSTGEYGGFVEMSGGEKGRMKETLSPVMLPGTFRVLNDNGEVSRSGYFFRIYLPGTGGVGVGEPKTGFTATSGLDRDLAEHTWCAYAWPVNYSSSGMRTFFICENGDILATEHSDYSRTGKGPTADAAFKSDKGKITGATAINGDGNDGRTWKLVN